MSWARSREPASFFDDVVVVSIYMTYIDIKSFDET